MSFKKIFQSLTIFLLSLFSIPLSVFAYSEAIIPGGQNIGIELHAKNVIVVGLYEVNGHYPGKEAGLKVGDSIIKVNQKEVINIDDMVKILQSEVQNEKISLTYSRNGDSYDTTLTVLKDENGVYRTGLYVKDQVSGIGTLTFIDPNTKLFGALGHEIIEKSTGRLLEIKDGKIYDSTVTNIIKSENGAPGEKNARFGGKKEQGTIYENTIHGIFGNYKDSLSYEKLYQVAQKEDIQVGNAVIRTVLQDNQAKDYAIHIDKINYNSTIKNISFTIVDQELLEETGGIIQGMSGSPILQGNFIIGAVTHVVVDSPTKGYGIYIGNMLEEAEN